MEELSKAIDASACGKAPGEECIPPKIIKYGTPALLELLLELLCLCWREGKVPQDMRDANITTLYKTKAIAVTATTSGVSPRPRSPGQTAGPCRPHLPRISVRLQGREIYSRHDLLSTPAQGEMSRAADAFIDLTKAFNLVSRQGLFQLLKKIGCPPQLLVLSITASFHDDMRGTVSYDGASSEPFVIRSGVKQGCVLASTLFGIFLSLLLNFAFRYSEEGVHLHTRSDGKLFNLSCLKAKSKDRTLLIREMLFADGAALTSHTKGDLQRLINRFAHACREFGLTISIKKTNVMGQDASAPPLISIDGEVPGLHCHQQPVSWLWNWQAHQNPSWSGAA